jgi:hypothetical protein
VSLKHLIKFLFNTYTILILIKFLSNVNLPGFTYSAVGPPPEVMLPLFTGVYHCVYFFTFEAGRCAFEKS